MRREQSCKHAFSHSDSSRRRDDHEANNPGEHKTGAELEQVRAILGKEHDETCGQSYKTQG